MTKKTHQYLIECTFDPNHNKWESWDGKTHLSYAAVKQEVWKLSQQEAEYNRTPESNEPHVHKIHGFRILSQYIETKTETITEILL